MNFEVQEIKSPLTLQMELTYDCNNYCTFCYNVWKDPTEKQQQEQQMLTFAEICAILDKLKKDDVFSIHFTGGEPTLHPDFLRIMEYAHHIGLMSGFVSNGNLLTEDYVKALKQAGTTSCQISLHGSTADRHEQFTQVKGSFRKAVQAITYLLAEDIHVNVNMTVNKKNMDDILNTARMVKELGIHSFSITRFVFSGTGNAHQQELGIERSDLDALLQELGRVEDELNIEVRILTPIPLCSIQHPDKVLGKMSKCDGGFSWCVISPSGDVRLCTNSKIIAGNVKNDSISDIWQHSNAFQQCRSLAYLPEECLGCEGFLYCGGGCRACAQNYSGCLHGIDPQANLQQIPTLNEQMPEILERYYGRTFAQRHQQVENLEEKILHRKPSVKGKIYLREEEFGLLVWNGHRHIIVNESGLEILNHCTGEQTVADMIAYFANKYHESVDSIQPFVIDFFKQLILLDFLHWKS